MDIKMIDLKWKANPVTAYLSVVVFFQFFFLYLISPLFSVHKSNWYR